MLFKIGEESFHTRDMVSLEINGVYLTLYVDPPGKKVFIQTFEEERGVTIHAASPEQTQAVLEIYSATELPDIASCCRKIGELVASGQWEKMPKSKSNENILQRNEPVK